MKFDEAEDEYIHAIAWDPSYKEAWSALENLGKAVGFRVEQHAFLPPPGMLGHSDNGTVQIGIIEDKPAWLAFTTCKAVWRFEPGFSAKRRGQKDGTPYSWTSDEEKECVESYLEASLSAIASDREKKKMKPLEGDELVAVSPADVQFLMAVMKSGMLYEYVVFEDIGRRCPAVIALLPEKTIKGIEGYIRKFVVVHVGPVGDGTAG